MSVYVRLQNGAEDEYARYKAKGDWLHDGASDPWGDPKPGYETVIIEVQVEVNTDGALVIKKGPDQVGYYPSGAWLSWRTD